MAISVTASKSPAVTQEVKIEALNHLSRSLWLINRRMTEERDVALSNTTLAVIIALTQLERLMGYDSHGLVHFRGFQRIIELRGGISTLVSECPILAQKALHADFDFALQLGSPTKFSAEYIPGQTTVKCLRETYRRTHTDATWPFITQSNERLREVHEEVSILAWLVNENAVHGIRVDDFEFHSILLLVGHHLLNLRPLEAAIDIEASDDFGVLLQFGLTALLTRFFVILGLKQPHLHLLIQGISTAAQELRCDDREAREALLWLLFTGEATVLKDMDENIWLVPRISQTANLLGLSTWDEVYRVLRKFPWIPVFEDATAQGLWNRIEPSSSY